jgi:hypothetical protein
MELLNNFSTWGFYSGEDSYCGLVLGCNTVWSWWVGVFPRKHCLHLQGRSVQSCESRNWGKEMSRGCCKWPIRARNWEDETLPFSYKRFFFALPSSHPRVMPFPEPAVFVFLSGPVSSFPVLPLVGHCCPPRPVSSTHFYITSNWWRPYVGTHLPDYTAF